MVENWCKQHYVRIIDNNKRAYVRAPMNVRYFQNALDYNDIVKDTVRFETQPLYTVEIAESELRKIAEFEHQV